MKTKNVLKLLPLILLAFCLTFTVKAEDLKAFITVSAFDSNIKEASIYLYPVDESMKKNLVESGILNTSQERKELEKIEAQIAKSNIQPVLYLPGTNLPARMEIKPWEIYFLKAKSQDLWAYSLIGAKEGENPVYLKFDKVSNPPKKDSHQKEEIQTSVHLNDLLWKLLLIAGTMGLGFVVWLCKPKRNAQ